MTMPAISSAATPLVRDSMVSRSAGAEARQRLLWPVAEDQQCAGQFCSSEAYAAATSGDRVQCRWLAAMSAIRMTVRNHRILTVICSDE